MDNCSPTMAADHARSQTVDEYGILVRNLFTLAGLNPKEVRGVIISSVVPPLNSTLEGMSERYFEIPALFVGPGVKTGMPILYDNPQDVCADRIVNSVAAYRKVQMVARASSWISERRLISIASRSAANTSAERLHPASASRPTRFFRAPPASGAWKSRDPEQNHRHEYGALAASCSHSFTWLHWIWWTASSIA